ncbi:hypothetical protein D0A39_10045 [Xanthomonas campestris pv. campestris]|nr:hypothetical protein D0A39_10045 [Xanthomonas campestris pv. campestris]
MGARALERPRRKRGPGCGAGVGVRVRRQTAICESSAMSSGGEHVSLHSRQPTCAPQQRAQPRTLIRRYAPPSPVGEKESKPLSLRERGWGEGTAADRHLRKFSHECR